jgi:hypothetical protein
MAGCACGGFARERKGVKEEGAEERNGKIQRAKSFWPRCPRMPSLDGGFPTLIKRI